MTCPIGASIYNRRMNTIRFLLPLLLLALPTQAKLKVFILAGQSNMEGAGQIQINPRAQNKGAGTLEFMVKQTPQKHGHLQTKSGEWRVRTDVWVKYGERGGGLKPGFGARSSTIGPELGFGTVVGDALKEQVLIIKTCWGGKTLMVDFRPPCAGPLPKAMADKMLAGIQRREPDATMKVVEERTGAFYRLMMKEVTATLKNLKAIYPAYDGKGYEIAGFGWHQGWNDGLSHEMVAAYEENLVRLIKDVRREWKTPHLPAVIAVSGFGGRNQKVDRRLGIIAAQHGAAKREDFKGTVASVETRDFFRPREQSPGGQGYHWNNNAETYYHIGEGMGKAMVELLK